VKVADFMTRDVTAVTADTTLKEVAKVLSRRRLSGLPVVDEEQHVIGFISERDLIDSIFPGRFAERDDIRFPNFALIATQLAKAGEKRVFEYMTREPVCVAEEATEEDVVELMITKDLKILPVTRENKLVGVVTRADLYQALIEKAEAEEE
jgi:CBS domain-containing protein